MVGAKSLDEGWLRNVDGPTLPRLLCEILIAGILTHIDHRCAPKQSV